MVYDIDDIIRSVRIALEHNDREEALTGIPDPDTLLLDELIMSKIEPGAKEIVTAAPLTMLEGGQPLHGSISWFSGPGGLSWGRLPLPLDFLRLVTFRMQDWDYSISEPIEVTDPRYKLQSSAVAGLRGTPRKPVVAILPYPGGEALEFYSSAANTPVAIARYQPIPHIHGRGIDIPAPLWHETIISIARHVMAALTTGPEVGAVGGAE